MFFEVMKLSERIDEDLRGAMRTRDTSRLGVLRLLKSALKNSAIEKGETYEDLSDADVIAVIRKQVKQRQDSIESFEKGGRGDLALSEKAELEILKNYLPQAMSQQEIEEIVRGVIAELGATSRQQMGQVMKVLTEKVAGRADGRALSAEVQRQLQ